MNKKTAYSSLGKIFVKDSSDERHLIKTKSDISKFGDLEEAKKALTERSKSRSSILTAIA